MIEPLAQTLGVSIIELVNGEHISNKNISSNMIKSKFYACPICGNVIHTMGESIISCCGVLLPTLEEEKENEKNKINCEKIENNYFISLNHPMTKNHYISFIAYITNNSCDLVKLYPEQDAEARFQIKGKGRIYALCNKDGLIFKDI